MAITAPKTTVRRRKISTDQPTDSIPSAALTSPNLLDVQEVFTDLIRKINQSQNDFEKIQKEISQIRQSWDQEKKAHEIELIQREQQEQLDRKREQEAYDYELSRSRKKAHDELTDQKVAWQKEIQNQQEDMEAEKEELIRLKTQVAAFEGQMEKRVKEAQEIIAQQVTEKFETGNKLTNQTNKSEKEMLSAKIANLSDENARQAREIEALKKALDEATKQVKEIAVKVIESGGNLAKPHQTPEA